MPPIAGSLGGSLADSMGASLAGGGATVESLLGDSYRLEYDAAIYTPGTGGVAIGPDQANLDGGGEYDTVNAVTGTRPDPSTALGYPSWLFVRANADFLEALNAATSLIAAGGLPWVIVAAKMTVTNVTSHGIMEITDGTVNNGVRLGFSLADVLQVRAATATRGAVFATAAFTDTTNIALMEVDLMSDRVRLRVNGTASDSSVSSTGGLAHTLDTVQLGRIAAGGWGMDGHQLALAAADNPTEDQKTAVREFYANKFGVTLA